MNTTWTTAAAAAVARAGTVRTRLLALGVLDGHPPRLAGPSNESAVIPPGTMDATGWSLTTGRCRTRHARSGLPRGTVEVVLAVAAGALVHTSAVPVAAPVLVCLATAGSTLAFVEAAVRYPADRITAAAARATSVQHIPQAAVTATHEAAEADLARCDITCANLPVVTDLSRRRGFMSVTVACSVCIVSVAPTSGIQDSFTARVTCTAPIGTFRRIPLGATGDRRPSGVPA
ncbi:hypothetical protein ABZ541_23875 [Micromonospora sediminicola]|uniref:hypothetical protein n=1 Tax=Micromonospora sediminicola TaxID=946078 RepID=UPI00340645D0